MSISSCLKNTLPLQPTTVKQLSEFSYLARSNYQTFIKDKFSNIASKKSVKFKNLENLKISNKTYETERNYDTIS